MKIPVTTNYKPVRLVLEFEGEHNGAIMLRVCDPKLIRTDYLRRRVPFKTGMDRKIEVPLPFTPRAVQIEIQGSAGKLANIKKTSMEDNGIWATPEQHRYMSLAVEFARKAGYLPLGNYTNEEKDFIIQYPDFIKNQSGRIIHTPARVNRLNGRVQVAKRRFQEYSIPIRVAILAHEGCHYFLDTGSEQRADLCGISWYLKMGFPKIEAVYAATKVFSQYPGLVGAEEVERTRTLIDFIKNHKEHGRN